MAKTADVLKAIWADPWFLALPPDGKLIFLWGITNEHSNMAGLYVVAEETVRHETKFSGPRLSKALELVHPKMAYRPETGYVVIPGRPNRVRSKTSQIAKSIIEAVRECPHSEIQSHYVAKYEASRWLGEGLKELALELGLGEPQRASANLLEVASHSHSPSSKERDRGSGGKGKQTDLDSLPAHFDPVVLGPAALQCHEILKRTAEARGAKPVHLLPVARAIEQHSGKDHVAVAGAVEHWLVHGNGSKRPAKDVVARFRNFLADSPDAEIRVSKTDASKYDAQVERVQV